MDESDKLRAFQEMNADEPKCMSKDGVRRAPRSKGLYAISCDGVPTFLYVGQATERQGKGLWERLKLHRGSNPDNDNLAGLLSADGALAAWQGFDFKDRDKRQQFLQERCCYRTVELPGLKNEDLDDLEKWVVGRANPRLNVKFNPTPNRELTAAASPCEVAVAQLGPISSRCPSGQKEGQIWTVLAGAVVVGIIAGAIYLLRRQDR
jgi:hypothetical protein